MKRENDIQLGNPILNQSVCDPLFRAIVLNPNLFALDVEMKQASILLVVYRGKGRESAHMNRAGVQ
jgi:hypothetical protein